MSTPLLEIKRRWQTKALNEGLSYKEARRLANEEERRLLRLEQLKYIKEREHLDQLNKVYSSVWQFSDFHL